MVMFKIIVFYHCTSPTTAPFDEAQITLDSALCCPSLELEVVWPGLVWGKPKLHLFKDRRMKGFPSGLHPSFAGSAKFQMAASRLRLRGSEACR